MSDNQTAMRAAAEAACPQDATCPALSPGNCWRCEQTAQAVVDAYQAENEVETLRAALAPVVDQARHHVADDQAWTGKETVWVPMTIEDLRTALAAAALAETES